MSRNTETILTNALRVAAEVFDHDAAVAGTWSPRIGAQFKQQAADSRALADFIEERGIDALEDGPIGVNTLAKAVHS